MIKQQIKNAALLALLALSFINRLIPKANIIIFFTNNSESNDNNRALLKRLVQLGYAERYRIYFFSKDGDRYRHLSEVKYKGVLLAPFYFLFSRYCFYDCGTLKIKPSKSQKVVSLWHGVPLKKIGLAIDEQSSKLDRYNDFTKILVPHSSWAPIYQEGFDCTKDQILINGFPRNDYLFHADPNVFKKLGITNFFDRVVLWMPTFRKSLGGRYTDGAPTSDNWDLPLFENLHEIESFNEQLVLLNTCLVIKLHPYSVLNQYEYKSLSNIFFVKNSDLNSKGILNYEFVACFDALITDYSSILFDYLLLDRPMAFTIDDLDSYTATRGFNVENPEDYLVGDKVRNSKDLWGFINKTLNGEDLYRDERKKLAVNVHENIDGHATQRLIEYLGL